MTVYRTIACSNGTSDDGGWGYSRHRALRKPRHLSLKVTDGHVTARRSRKTQVYENRCANDQRSLLAYSVSITPRWRAPRETELQDAAIGPVTQ
jgi:hypothetical protein